MLKAISFAGSQARDWKVTVTRTSVDRFLYQMVFPYLSIYIIALGATATQLGIVISIGMAMAGICAPFIGWLIDRGGPKRIYLLGIGLLAVSYLAYGLAQNWALTLAAMIAYWLGYSISTHSCATVCGNCLANTDRATGMMFCETVAAGILGMAGPILGAWVVTMSGGVSASGIRPLFFLCFLGSVGTFFFVLTQLSSRKWRTASDDKPNVLRDLRQVLKQGRNLKRWLLIAAISQLPTGLIFPFSQVFAHQVKGADEFVLGAIVTGSALTSIVLAIPLGRWADQVGRKRVLYLTIPLFWLSNLVLVWAFHPVLLILAGVLQGFFYLGGPIVAAMERELVPADQMGQWLGIARLIKLLLSAGLTLVSGIIWDRVGPEFVFLLFIALDLIIRMPLLIGMPETLRLRVGRQVPVLSTHPTARS